MTEHGHDREPPLASTHNTTKPGTSTPADSPNPAASTPRSSTTDPGPPDSRTSDQNVKLSLTET